MARTLKVVFRIDVRGIAQAGDVKTVSPGYARNYLFPRDLAFPATPASLRQWETERQGWLAKADRVRQDSQDLAQKLGAIVIKITAKASPEGRLFGSVNRAEIAASLAQQGLPTDKRWIELPEPIKQVGTTSVPVRLNAGVVAQVKVEVIAEEPEPTDE